MKYLDSAELMFGEVLYRSNITLWVLLTAQLTPRIVSHP